MIIMFLIILLTVLPHLWEYIFSRTLQDTANPTKGQLVLTSFAPIGLMSLILLSGTNWAPDEVLIGIILFVIVFNTIAWGYVMYHRKSAPAWIWLLLVFLTFCLLLMLLFFVLFAGSSSWNLNF